MGIGEFVVKAIVENVFQREKCYITNRSYMYLSYYTIEYLYSLLLPHTPLLLLTFCNMIPVPTVSYLILYYYSLLVT